MSQNLFVYLSSITRYLFYYFARTEEALVIINPDDVLAALAARGASSPISYCHFPDLPSTLTCFHLLTAFSR